MNKNIYIAAAITTEANKNYAIAIKRPASDNLLNIAQINGIKIAQLCATKKQAEEFANAWNEVYKANKTYALDVEPAEPSTKKVFEQVDYSLMYDEAEFYFDDEGLFGRDGKNGIVIVGNSNLKAYYYCDEKIEARIKQNYFNSYMYFNKDILTRFLSKATHKKYACAILRGYSQSDWNYCFYPEAEFDQNWINEIEAYYFGKYNQYADTSEEGSIYTVTDYEEAKQSLAAQTGYNANDIVIKQIVGSRSTPIYEEV